MTARERLGDGGGTGGEGLSDGELLELAARLARTRGRTRAARDVGLNYRTLANAIDERTLTRHVRETLLAAHRAGTLTGEATVDEPVAEEPAAERAAEALARRVEVAEAQLADALGAVERERARAEVLERRLEALEQQASEPGTEQPGGEPKMEPPTGAAGTGRTTAESAAVPESAPDQGGTHRAGVVTLEPLAGEKAALGDAAELVAEWRRLRGDAQHGSSVERARAEERRWELEIELIGEHGLALPPETEPLHPSRRDDHLRWRRLALRRARRQRVRAERLLLLRRVLTLGLWRR